MRTLFNLEIHVAHACNFTCESCAHYSNQRHKGIVSLTEAEQWMGAWAGRISPTHFSLVGGEPAIHPQLTRFVELARRCWPDAEIRLVTNGLLLHRHPDLPLVMGGDPNTCIYLSVHHDAPEYVEAMGPVLDLLEGWRSAHGVRVSTYRSFLYWTRRYKGYGAAMEPYDDGKPRQSWERCHGKLGPQLFEGKLWKCAPLAYLPMQDEKYGLSERWKPYLDYQPLTPDCTDEQLDAFLNREHEPQCAMCPADPERFKLSIPVVLPTGRGAHKPVVPVADADVPRAAAHGPAPAIASQPATLGSTILQLPVPLTLTGEEDHGWRRLPAFEGSTPNLVRLMAHASVLAPGRYAHDGQSHIDEELKLILDGRAQLVVFGSDDTIDTAPRYPLDSGGIVYYPALNKHTIYNRGDTNLNYFTVRWVSLAQEPPQRLEKTIIRDLEQGSGSQTAHGPKIRRLLNGPTRHLSSLNVYVCTIDPGEGFAARVVEQDVLVFVLAGTVESAGRRTGPAGLVYFAPGRRHGLRNPGPLPAVCLFYEFRGRKAQTTDQSL